MPGLYKNSGYNLDRMELKWMWRLDSQVERRNEEEVEQKRKDTALTTHPKKD